MNYIGISIGPIFKTIEEANTPIGLWFGSTFFSYFSRTLCKNLSQMKEVQIFSPYFDEADLQNDGIGMYHDRILFAFDSEDFSKVNTIIESSKAEMASYFPEQIGTFKGKQLTKQEIKDFLCQYIKVSYVIQTEEELQGKNILLTLNRALDALELMVNIQESPSENLFQALFVGKKNNRNCYLKETGLYREVNKFFSDTKKNHLNSQNGHDLRSIEDIARAYKNKDKLQNYFAIVYSDGDKVGKLLEDLCKKEMDIIPEQVSHIKAFSEVCLAYAKAASRLVHDEYQGMTIYAGGDDLLFLAPVEKIFDLCSRLNEMFKQKLSEKFEESRLRKIGVSLSFGIGIYYYKYPLYEALASAKDLLFDRAKGKGGNQIALQLRKHSGQSIKMYIPNDKVRVVDALLRESYADEKRLQSLLYKLGEIPIVFQKLLEQVIKGQLSKEDFLERFMNQFDNEGQKEYEEYIKKILMIFYDEYLSKEALHALSDTLSDTLSDKSHYESALDTLTYMLRLLKFWQGGEE